MQVQNKHRPLTFQVTLAVIAAAAFSFVLVFAFSVYAVMGVDRIAVERQKTFVRSGLAEQVQNLIREQQSVTVWDDAVINAKAGNQDWMAENLGEWMHSYYGHERVYVLDDGNRPVHVMKDGRTLPPSAFDEEAAAVMPLVLKLRDQLDRAASNAGGSVTPAVAKDLVLIGKTPAIVSVQPIVPSCVVPECNGALSILSRQEKDALWEVFFTAAPARRRVFEPSSKRRKRAPGPLRSATD